MGLTAERLEQIRRACRAIELLAQGRRVVDVALELGYSDQAHMTRALKAIMGRTPGEIARARTTPPSRDARALTEAHALGDRRVVVVEEHHY